MRAADGRVALVVNGVTVVGVVVDLAIAGVEQQLEERVGMRVIGAGAHLHGEQEKEYETQNADQRQLPAGIQSSGPSRG